MATVGRSIRFTAHFGGPAVPGDWLLHRAVAVRSRTTILEPRDLRLFRGADVAPDLLDRGPKGKRPAAPNYMKATGGRWGMRNSCMLYRLGSRCITIGTSASGSSWGGSHVP